MITQSASSVGGRRAFGGRGQKKNAPSFPDVRHTVHPGTKRTTLVATGQPSTGARWQEELDEPLYHSDGTQRPLCCFLREQSAKSCGTLCALSVVVSSFCLLSSVPLCRLDLLVSSAGIVHIGMSGLVFGFVVRVSRHMCGWSCL